MTTRSRRQTRQRRTGGWAPDEHNEHVRIHKSLQRAAKRYEELRRAHARMLRRLTAVERYEQERQRQIAHADRMASLGFDMRDEHEALDRGELIE